MRYHEIIHSMLYVDLDSSTTQVSAIPPRLCFDAGSSEVSCYTCNSLRTGKQTSDFRYKVSANCRHVGIAYLSFLNLGCGSSYTPYTFLPVPVSEKGSECCSCPKHFGISFSSYHCSKFPGSFGWPSVYSLIDRLEAKIRISVILTVILAFRCLSIVLC